MRYEGVLVGYAEDSPSVRAWNPFKETMVLNVRGAYFDEGVGRSSCLERPGVANLEEVEVVTFLGVDGVGDSQADEDGPVAGGDGTPAAPPSGDGGGAEEDHDMPTLVRVMMMMRTLLPQRE